VSRYRKTKAKSGARKGSWIAKTRRPRRREGRAKAKSGARKDAKGAKKNKGEERSTQRKSKERLTQRRKGRKERAKAKSGLFFFALFVMLRVFVI
jgi:hypothetical protein